MIINNLGSFGSVHFFCLFPVPAHCAIDFHLSMPDFPKIELNKIESINFPPLFVILRHKS